MGFGEEDPEMKYHFHHILKGCTLSAGLTTADVSLNDPAKVGLSVLPLQLFCVSFPFVLFGTRLLSAVSNGVESYAPQPFRADYLPNLLRILSERFIYFSPFISLFNHVLVSA